MKHRAITLATLALIAILLTVSPVLAYVYRATYTVTSENTTDFEMLGVSTDNGVNNQWMADNGYFNSTANDTRIETLGGLEKPHMITDNATFTAIPVPASSQTNLYFSTGNSELDSFYVITGYNGYVTVADNATIELGDNFTVEQSGWWDTDAGNNKLAVHKPVAFRTFVSPIVSENITSQVLGDASSNALDFELDNSDFVSVPDDGDFTFTNGTDTPFSIATYIKLESVGTIETILSKWTTAGAQIEWAFFVGAAGKLIAVLSDTDHSNYLEVLGDTVLSTGVWYHVAMTYNGDEAWTDVKLYVNGTEETNTDSSVGSYAGMTGGTATVNIGAIDAGANLNFDGIIYGVKIYDVELTAAEVEADAWLDHKATDLVALWLLTDGAGNPADTSGNGHNATSNNADWVTADTPSQVSVTATGVSSGEHIVTTTCGGALDFVRANSDWVSIPDHDDFSFTDGAGTDKPFSIVTWVKLDDATSSRIVTKRLLNNNEWGLATTGADSLYLLLSNPTSTVYIARTTAAVTGYEGAWIHIVATYDGTEAVGGIDIYINGVVADTGDLTAGAYAGMSRGAAVLELGSTDGGTVEFLDGLLDNVKIYDVELTPAEALADYDGGHKSTDLVAWYQLEEGTGNPTDSSGNGHNATANLADWVSVLRIYIDATLEDEDITAAYSVPDTTANWIFLQNNVMPYSDNTSIEVDGVVELWFRPTSMIIGTTLPDRAGGDHPGTFIWGANPQGVSVAMGGLVSEAQPSPGVTVADPTQDIMPGVEVTDWYIEPDVGVGGALLTNPMRPFVTMMSDTTTLTELQAWRLLGTALVLMVLVGTIRAVRGHLGIASIATAAIILGMVVWTIYPMWTLVLAAVMFIAGLIAERSPSL